jgi:hypothetical protein
MLPPAAQKKSGRISSSRPARAGLMTPIEDRAGPSASMAMRLAGSARTARRRPFPRRLPGHGIEEVTVDGRLHVR